jgi:hypothetical protein
MASKYADDDEPSGSKYADDDRGEAKGGGGGGAQAKGVGGGVTSSDVGVILPPIVQVCVCVGLCDISFCVCVSIVFQIHMSLQTCSPSFKSPHHIYCILKYVCISFKKGICSPCYVAKVPQLRGDFFQGELCHVSWCGSKGRTTIRVH